MNTVVHRTFAFLLAAVFFLAVVFYGYSQEIYLLIIPVALVAAILLVQYPEYLFYILMLSIPWSVEYNFTPSLGTDLPDEPLMLLAGFSFLLWFIYQRKKMDGRQVHPLVVLIGLQFLWMLITMVTSTDLLLSLKYVLAKTWYLLAFLALPLSLWRNETILKRSFILLLLSMILAMLLVVIRHGQHNWTFESINESVEPFFRNHVNYSALLVFTVPLQIAVARLSSSRKMRIFLYMVLAITFAAVYFSYARGAWLALVAGLVTYWLLQKRVLLFVFLFSVLAVVVATLWLQSNDRFLKLSNDYKTTIFHTNFGEHLVATYQLKDLSNAERVYRWVAGVRMIKDSWRTGFGPSSFYRQYKAYTLPAFKTYVSDNPEHSTVHNYFLLMLVEQGIIGCLLFLVLLAALFWYAQKIYHGTVDPFWKTVVAAAASVLVMECVINFLSDMIETDKAGSVFYLSVAVLVIAAEKTRSDLSTNVQRIS